MYMQNLILQIILTPPVLFFLVGVFSVLLNLNLEIPSPKLFSLYLLISIGFKGGIEIKKSGFGNPVLPTFIAAIIMSAIITIIGFLILRSKLDRVNSAAIAAAYGSISAITFTTAESLLESQISTFDGFMVGALALMQLSAMMTSSLLLQFRNDQTTGEKLNKSIFNSPYLLLSSSIVGFLTASSNLYNIEKLEPFTKGLFYGVECFFLLAKGIQLAKNLVQQKFIGGFLFSFAIFMPLVNAILGVLVARFLSLEPGNALLFVTLCSSASNLTAPLVLNTTEANSGDYITTSGITFLFNIVLGIPIYMSLVNTVIPF